MLASSSRRVVRRRCTLDKVDVDDARLQGQAATPAARYVAQCGVPLAQVLNLRTLKPIDRDAIVKSVSKTHRVVVVEEGWPQSGVASGAVFIFRVCLGLGVWCENSVQMRYCCRHVATTPSLQAVCACFSWPISLPTGRAWLLFDGGALIICGCCLRRDRGHRDRGMLRRAGCAPRANHRR